MALRHRVGINVNSLLARCYGKKLGKIGNFATGNVQPKNDETPTTYETFYDMISFRQEQAKRSIVLKVTDLYALPELKKYVPYPSQVVNFLPYTAIHDRVFVLIEYKTVEIVTDVINSSYYIPMKDIVHVYTPMLAFKATFSRNKCAADNKKMAYAYANFKDCTIPKMYQQLHSSHSVANQMVALHNLLSISDMDTRLRFYTAAQITFYVSKLFKNLSVVPFGSSVNGFGQLGCDLDLMCQLNSVEKPAKWVMLHSLGQHYTLEERHHQLEYLELVSLLMKSCIPGIVNIKKILEARVPIIKFYNTFTNMQCDISSNNLIALKMSEILYTYSKFDWRVKPLVFTIRRWARNENITKTVSGPWMTNFSLTLLIISYLQKKKVLPGLDAMETFEVGNRHKRANVKGKYNWFQDCKRSLQLTNTDNLYSLLYGFFEYYSIFDFNEHAICIRSTTTKRKADSSPLYICNPLQYTLNVSKNVHFTELRNMIDKLHVALKILIDTDESCALLKLLKLVPSETTANEKILKDIKNKRFNDTCQDDDDNSPEEMSMNLDDVHLLEDSSVSNAKSTIK